MKTLGAVAMIVLGIMGLIGCKDEKPVQADSVTQKKLSDTYATDALLALKAIQRNPFVPAKGSQLVSRFTQEKIDVADVAAVSNDEKSVTAALNSVYHVQLDANQHKEKMKADGNLLSTLDVRNKKIADAWVKLMEAESAEQKSLDSSLEACYTTFDASLRARLPDIPAACGAR
jgi:hypothetical protein